MAMDRKALRWRVAIDCGRWPMQYSVLNASIVERVGSALANERVQTTDAGKVVLRLKTPRRDLLGTRRREVHLSWLLPRTLAGRSGRHPSDAEAIQPRCTPTALAGRLARMLCVECGLERVIQPAWAGWGQIDAITVTLQQPFAGHRRSHMKPARERRLPARPRQRPRPLSQVARTSACLQRSV